MADAAEHEAAVLPACFHPKSSARHEREARVQTFSLSSLLQKEPFWCYFPSPSVQPAGVKWLCLVGDRGRTPDPLWSSSCPPGHQLLPLRSRQLGWGECGKSSQGGVACYTTPGARRQEPLSRVVKSCCNTGRYVTGRVLCPGLLQRRKCSAERWWHLLQDRPPFMLNSTWEGASWSTARETPGHGAERELEVGLVRRGNEQWQEKLLHLVVEVPN